MDRCLPFALSLLFFMTCWYILLYFPYLESVSPNKAILYATISMILTVIMFIMLSLIYYFEDIDIDDEEYSSRFKTTCIFDPYYMTEEEYLASIG